MTVSEVYLENRISLSNSDLNPFINGSGVEVFSGRKGFSFEEDFIDENVRCIPMIVRFKLDMVGVKLKLAEWSKFNHEERNQLMSLSAITYEERLSYKMYLCFLIRWRANSEASELIIETDPPWLNKKNVPESVKIQAAEYNCIISNNQWGSLNNLERFALIKLSKPGHENKNFPKAIVEFGLISAC